MIAALKNSDIPPKAGSVKEMVDELEYSLYDRLGHDGSNHNHMICMSFTCDKDAYEKLNFTAVAGKTDN